MPDKDNKDTTKLLYGLRSVLPGVERETAGYEYRAAPGTAITGNGANDTSVRP